MKMKERKKFEVGKWYAFYSLLTTKKNLEPDSKVLRRTNKFVTVIDTIGNIDKLKIRVDFDADGNVFEEIILDDSTSGYATLKAKDVCTDIDAIQKAESQLAYVLNQDADLKAEYEKVKNFVVEITVIKSESLSKNKYCERFVITNKETGEVLDDAHGHGYKTVKKAYSAWSWKHRDKSQDSEKAKKREHIKQWLKEHKSFEDAMDFFAIDVAKGRWGRDEEFNANFVKRMLRDNELEIDFTESELLKVWRKRFAKRLS